MKRIARAIGVALAAAVLVGSLGLLLFGDNHTGRSPDRVRMDKAMDTGSSKHTMRGNG